jgi:hypothetical protein
MQSNPRNLRRALAAVAILCTLASGAAFAKELSARDRALCDSVQARLEGNGPRGGRGGGGEGRRERMLERLDTNHNGKIDPEEREAARAARGARGGEGQANGREAFQERAKRRQELLAAFDRDGDGNVSADEGKQAKSDLLAKFDADKNGAFNGAEKDAVCEALLAGKAEKK